jgi:hypothetical protein
MKVKEYINASFEKWWKEEQGDRMPKSKYLAKKAWKEAFKSSLILHKKVVEKYEQFLFN